MLSKELVGRRVKVHAWYDYAPLIATRRGPLTLDDGGPVGTITHINEPTRHVTVRIETLNCVCSVHVSDVEVLP